MRKASTRGVSHSSSDTPEDWPASGLEHLGRCPLCADTHRTILHEGLTDTLFHAPGLWVLQRCERCQSFYLDPRPSHESLPLAYRSYYTHDVQPDDDPRKAGHGAVASLKQAILRAYLRGRFGAGWRPRDALALFLLLRPRIRIAVDGAMRQLPRPKASSTVLDIGCGNGRFLAWAATAGWAGEGTEVDDQAADRARALGIPVHTGGVHELVKAGRQFEAVTVSHVIEHVHDPAALVQAARALLKPGGHFWIETPNARAYGHQVFGRHWRGLEPPRHLQLFTPEALGTLLLRAGFVDVRTAPWQLDWANMASLSRAIAGQVDPRPLWQRLFGEPAERLGQSDPAQREFITLTATVPL
jgi:2-polyprenyl-3-methyl-5-hydroxy-6-metoxy-1,4-benzoquinol methylase